MDAAVTGDGRGRRQADAGPRADRDVLTRRRVMGLGAGVAAAAGLGACDVWNLVGRPDARSPGGSPLSIPALRARAFPPTEIRLHAAAARHDAYTAYLMTHEADGLRLTGMAAIPKGRGPFPVVLLNHGYTLPAQFETGDGTRVLSDALAQRGYLTLATDYRGLGGSEDDAAFNPGARLEFVIDVLSLAASAPTLPEAQDGPIGAWGHSLGGELAVRAAAVDPNIGPLASWAALSVWIDDIVDYYRVPTSRASRGLRAALSAGNYLDALTGPVDIHQGEGDRVVDPAWASKLHAALTAAGVASQLHLYPNLGHELTAGAHQVVRDTVRFFERSLPPAG